MLYEAALGVGMAVCPLLGGMLGQVSWHGPFFGTAALMAIAFIAIIVMLRREPVPAERISLTAGFKALHNPAVLVLSGTAVAYNYAFFTLLAYSPFPIEEAVTAAGSTFEAQELGLVVFGWGLALAIASALIAPMLTRRFGLGVLNTALTETVMEATDLPRNVASSTYSGVRFLGGAIAPAVSGPIAAALGAGAPYWSRSVRSPSRQSSSRSAGALPSTHVQDSAD